MKQCPNCRATYADDSLRFCLNDGANLIEMTEPAATVQMSFDKNPVRVNVAPDSVPTFIAPPIQTPPTPTTRQGISPIIVGFLGVLFLLTIGAFAAFIFLRPATNQTPVVSASPTPTLAPTATPNDETAKLKEKVANLQEQIQNQKNQKTEQPIEKSASPNNAARTARANSPRDGFLALRSEPSSEAGYRIAQIPHGATLTVLGCPRPSNVGKMPGRWCQVVYNGQSGWAFDAFMTF